MGVRIDGEELRRALAMRGLLQQDLARLAGVSETGISLAIRGRPIRPSTFGRIAQALAAAPVVELSGAERLFGPRATDTTAAPGPSPEAAVTEATINGRRSRQ